MSFKSLEQRFNENVKVLYRGADQKFAGGRPSSGNTDQPLLTQTPGLGYIGQVEGALGRALPISSTARDVQRLTLFSASSPGLVFLAKQQLLQSGNTFAQTRILNPAFVVGNAVPFLHIRRHLRPNSGPFGITSSRDVVRKNARLLGQLQPATFETVKAKYLLNSAGIENGRINRLRAYLFRPFTDTITSFRSPRDVGERGGRRSPGDGAGWGESRPEIGIYKFLAEFDKSPIGVEDQKKNFQKDADKFFREMGGEITIREEVVQPAGVDFGLDLPPQIITSVIPLEPVQPFLKYFTSDLEAISSRSELMNARDLAKNARDSGRRISYIRDPLNDNAHSSSENLLDRYKKLKTAQVDGTQSEKDPITVSFAMGSSEHVQFRAFIKDLRISIAPEYNPVQYVGRIEKFVTYTGVQRTVSFGLDIIAFSKKELDVVWNRINYLTGFAYPYGITKGIYQPNIIRFTIGNVYKDQPGYLSSIDFSFNEAGQSWDIDRGVPIGASCNMSFNIIEKNTKAADSSFYAITE
jgi:hypothetical protein